MLVVTINSSDDSHDHFLCCFPRLLCCLVRKRAKIRNRYNQVPHLTLDTNGKVTNSKLEITNESGEVSPSKQVTTTQSAGKHRAYICQQRQYKVVCLWQSTSPEADGR